MSSELIRPETIAFFGYLIAVLGAPAGAACLLYTGLSRQRVDYVHVTLGTILMLCWPPVLVVAPDVIRILLAN